MTNQHLTLAGLRIEYRDIGHSRSDKPPIILLHEGLGSISLWRDFPQKLAAKTGNRVIAWSRAGYGHSAPYNAPRTARYLHKEAEEMLPLLLSALKIEKPILLGHSDGGTIGLIYAYTYPKNITALIAIAPHEYNEPKIIEGILQAVHAFSHTSWPQKLAKHHQDARRVFHDWADTWLTPAFKNWSIVDDLSAITCPVLAIQGENDLYATMRQIEIIAEKAPQTNLLKIPDCGHNPAIEKETIVLAAIQSFIEFLQYEKDDSLFLSPCTKRRCKVASHVY